MGQERQKVKHTKEAELIKNNDKKKDAGASYGEVHIREEEKNRRPKN